MILKTLIQENAKINETKKIKQKMEKNVGIKKVDKNKRKRNENDKNLLE